MSVAGFLGWNLPNPSFQFKGGHGHPFGSSTSSSSSSPSSSIFSLDGASAHSSASTNPVDAPWENEGETQVTGRGPSYETNPICARGYTRGSAPKVADAVAPELRKHPRRTKSSVSQSNGVPCARPPPCLMRQSERKINFVENLVGKCVREWCDDS